MLGAVVRSIDTFRGRARHKVYRSGPSMFDDYEDEEYFFLRGLYDRFRREAASTVE